MRPDVARASHIEWLFWTSAPGVAGTFAPATLILESESCSNEIGAAKDIVEA